MPLHGPRPERIVTGCVSLLLCASCRLLVRGVASPLVVFERDEVSSVAGSLLLYEASETVTAGPQGPV
jgi:hypothetical protein